MEGPPKAQVDPAPLGPKERKLKREELALYQFICTAGQKVSPLAGSRDVGATTVNVLLNQYNNSGEIYRLIPLSLSPIQDIEKLPTLQGTGALDWQTQPSKALD